jgi:FtsH ternary system-like protein
VSDELRDRAEAERWLTAGLTLARLPVDLGVLGAWLGAAVSECGGLPPPGVVADVGALLHGRAFELPPLPHVAARLRAAVQGYEDQVLGRLATEPRMEAAVDAVAKLPAELRKDAVALFVGKLLDRTGRGGVVALAPAVVRRALKRPAGELAREGFAGLRAPATAERLAAGYEDLVAGARRAGSLIGEAEVFALENLSVLGSLNQRVAIEQIVQAAEELHAALPRRLRKRSHVRGVLPTHIEDESAYPIGGFAAVATVGTVENLVSSELMYMDLATAAARDVDLFDMRYAEGELLYYTRDESVFVRQQRVITFAIQPDLVEARFKDAGLGWQRLVVTFGLILCTVRRLIEWLAEEGLRFRIQFLRDGGGARPTPLGEELGLCGLLFREWIAKGMVEVGEAESLDAILAAARADARAAQGLVVSVGATDPFPTAAARGDPGLRLGALIVAGPTPRVRMEDGPRRRREPDEPDEPDEPGLAGWARAALELLLESA